MTFCLCVESDQNYSCQCCSFLLYTDLFATGVRRSLCRLQLHAVFCEVSVLHAPVQGCSSRTRGKTAGNRRSFVEAGGGKDLAEQGLVAINIGRAGEGKTKGAALFWIKIAPASVVLNMFCLE